VAIDPARREGMMKMPGQGGATRLFAGRLDGFGGKSHEAQLREVVDREEIRELAHIYAHRVAHGLSMADLFTDDGAYIQRQSADDPTPQEVRGRAALEAHYVTRPAGIAMPMIHNHLIEVAGDEASAICSIELRVGAEGSESMIASGYYQDRLRRVGGRWMFVERDVTFFHWVPLSQGWTRPKTQS
jgi:hypothetical protein